MNRNGPEKAGFTGDCDESVAGQVVNWVVVLSQSVWAAVSAVRPIIGTIRETVRLLLDFLTRTRRSNGRQSTGP